MSTDQVLMALCGLALSVGAWFFRELRSAVKDLASGVASLVTEIAVMRAERRDSDRRSHDHEQRIRALEQSES